MFSASNKKIQNALDQLGEQDFQFTTAKKASKAYARSDLCCANCLTTETPVWRRDIFNRYVCNACGIYSRLHKADRPVNNAEDRESLRKRKVVHNDHDQDSSKSQRLDDIPKSESGKTYSPASEISGRNCSYRIVDNSSLPPYIVNAVHQSKEVSKLRIENLSNPELHPFTNVNSLDHLDYARHSDSQRFHNNVSNTLAPIRSVPRKLMPKSNLEYEYGSNTSVESKGIIPEFSFLSVLANEATTPTTRNRRSPSNPMALKHFIS